MPRIRSLNAISRLWRLPILGEYFRRSYIRDRFPVELGLLRGEHSNENQNRSIIHFSVNKAATQYCKALLERCAAESGMTPVAIHELAFHTDTPYLDRLPRAEVAKYYHIFRPLGYLYSVFGGMIEDIPDLEEYLVVLVVRDPRDILVSGYYSYAHSHPEPSKRGSKYDTFMAKRRMSREWTIDEFVLRQSDEVLNIFERYAERLDKRYPHVYVTKYEDMTANFEFWLGGLIKYCELTISDELLESLVDRAAQMRPSKENIRKHVRKGVPGDYRNKLRPETVDQLTTRFASVLEAFDYA